MVLVAAKQHYSRQGGLQIKGTSSSSAAGEAVTTSPISCSHFTLLVDTSTISSLSPCPAQWADKNIKNQQSLAMILCSLNDIVPSKSQLHH